MPVYRYCGCLIYAIYIFCGQQHKFNNYCSQKSDEVKKKGMCQNFDTPPYALFNESFYFDLLTMS